MTKSTALSGAAFVLAAAVGLTHLFDSDPAPTAIKESSDALQARVQALEARLAALEGRQDEGSPSAPPRPSELASPPPVAAQGARDPLPRPESPGERPAAAAESSGASSSLGPGGEADPALDEQASAAVAERVLTAVDQRIDQAVAAKVEEVEAKRNKKPGLDTVVKFLELDEYQRRTVEDEVRQGQRQIRTLLEQPTANGTSLLDELVEAMAHGGRPEGGRLWGEWFRRITSEKIPGTDETYAARIEQTKGSVRDGFRRVFSEEQYAEFEAWAFDPTQVEGIADSPWADLGPRAAERAAELAREGAR